MRFFFIIQGEGRGHMTQAIALAAMLRRNGHDVNNVVVGKSDRRTIPEFFFEGIGAKVTQLSSPNFITDKKSKCVKIWPTILSAISRLGEYRQSIRTIDLLVQKEQPDVIINFYDFIGGVYSMLKSPNAKFICIAHQYLAGHSSFEFPKGGLMDIAFFKLGNWLTSYGAKLRMALSFQKYSDERVAVVPPLLRKEIKQLQTSDGDHLLIYLLNHGYSEEIDQFHNKYPDVELHCFWDKPGAPNELVVDETLTYHQLDSEKFLKFLASCAGYVTTAGFESICEAMYLDKPVMMIPVKGHYEQACNALDASRAGAGVSANSFDLKIFLDYLPNHKNEAEKFRSWCEEAESLFLQKLT